MYVNYAFLVFHFPHFASETMQGNSTEPLIETGFPKNPNSLWLGNEVSLPPSFRCSSNDINGLLDHVYHTVDITHPDHYFKKRCILAPREGDVNQINRIMLERFPGDLYEFGSKFEGKWINNYVMAPLSYRSKWDVPSLYCVLAAEELSPNFMDNFFQSRCSRENRSIEEAQGESFDILGLDLRYPSSSATPGSVLCRNRLCGSQIHWAYKYGRKSNQKGQS